MPVRITAIQGIPGMNGGRTLIMMEPMREDGPEFLKSSRESFQSEARQLKATDRNASDLS
jgi:hypothetical protein